MVCGTFAFGEGGTTGTAAVFRNVAVSCCVSVGFEGFSGGVGERGRWI